MLEVKKRECLRAGEILKLFKQGRRDFSGILCNNDSFDNMDLHGIIFKKADLNFCSFHSTNLEGADLSGANLEWTGFIRANLKRTNLEKVRAVWSRFNESQFEKTNMRGADLSWSLFFDTNLFDGADLSGAIIDTIATSPDQLTEEGMRKVGEQLGKMQGKIESELLIRLQLVANSTKETVTKDKSAGKNINVSYEGGDAAYSGGKGGYSVSGNADANSSVDIYTNRKRKHDAYE